MFEGLTEGLSGIGAAASDAVQQAQQAPVPPPPVPPRPRRCDRRTQTSRLNAAEAASGTTEWRGRTGATGRPGRRCCKRAPPPGGAGANQSRPWTTRVPPPTTWHRVPWRRPTRRWMPPARPVPRPRARWRRRRRRRPGQQQAQGALQVRSTPHRRRWTTPWPPPPAGRAGRDRSRDGHGRQCDGTGGGRHRQCARRRQPGHRPGAGDAPRCDSRAAARATPCSAKRAMRSAKWRPCWMPLPSSFPNPPIDFRPPIARTCAPLRDELARRAAQAGEQRPRQRGERASTTSPGRCSTRPMAPSTRPTHWPTGPWARWTERWRRWTRPRPRRRTPPPNRLWGPRRTPCNRRAGRPRPSGRRDRMAKDAVNGMEAAGATGGAKGAIDQAMAAVDGARQQSPGDAAQRAIAGAQQAAARLTAGQPGRAAGLAQTNQATQQAQQAPQRGGAGLECRGGRAAGHGHCRRSRAGRDRQCPGCDQECLGGGGATRAQGAVGAAQSHPRPLQRARWGNTANSLGNAGSMLG